MANETLAFFGPSSGFATTNGNPTGGSTQPYSTVGVGTSGVCGAAFNKGVVGSMMYLHRVPNAVALGTGLTFTLTLTDDPNNPPSAGGLNSYWGVTVTPITSGTTVPNESAFASSTEDKAAVTHGSTVNTIVTATVTAVVAHFNSLAAGNLALIRLRRIGTNVLDTYDGRAILLGLDVRNT